MAFKTKTCLLFIRVCTFMLLTWGWYLSVPLNECLAVNVTVDPKLGNEVTVSAIDTMEYLPDVAYNSKHNEYLVVWHTTWVIGSRDIRAARISAGGTVLATFVVYNHDTKDSSQPAVAYDPVNDRYLVTWSFDFFGDGSDWDLYGRFIPWDGPDAALSQFAITSLSTHQWHSRIAYASGMKEFLVVWNNEYQSGVLPMYISGRRITAADGNFPGSATDLTISHATENRVNPDVTYNQARNQYLVVYDNAVDVFGTRFSGTLSSSFGGEFGIAGWPGNEIRPAVSSCRGADQYLVVWQSDQNSSNDAIYGRFLSGEAVAGTVHLIDDTSSPEQKPDVTCNTGGTVYTVVWQTRYTNLKYGVWGRLLLPNEKMGTQFPIVQPSTGKDRTSPRVAAGSTNFLAAWQHEVTASRQDIHARIGKPYNFPWAMFLPSITTK